MKLRAYRTLLNMTQKQLAERLGVGELSVIKYESGTTIPSREMIRRIYAETGAAVTPNDFYDLETVQLTSGRVTTMSAAIKPLLAIGLMSGTSMDGIDAALLSTDGESFVKELGSASLQYDLEFKVLLKGAEYGVRKAEGDLAAAARSYQNDLAAYLKEGRNLDKSLIPAEIARLSRYFYGGEPRPILLQDVIQRSTLLHADAVKKVLEATGHGAREVDLIGYHGQTLFHRPAIGVTVQAGDGNYLADLCGIPVVFDFRSADVQAGGQGAPFAPLYHAALARQMGLAPLVVTNCGGISNITVITGNDAELYAFDTGPGNGLIDRFVFSRVGRPYDENGIYGLQGQVDPEVLSALRNRSLLDSEGRNYLDHPAPKSLDINDMLLVPELERLSLQDGSATLERFTAECIVNSLQLVTQRGIQIPHMWVVAGGGWNNPVILRDLQELLQNRLGNTVRVERAERVGWNGTALEAQIFAYLAVRSIKGLPLSVPGTTGVPNPISGGKFVMPNGEIRRSSGRVRECLQIREEIVAQQPAGSKKHNPTIEP